LSKRENSLHHHSQEDFLILLNHLIDTKGVTTQDQDTKDQALCKDTVPQIVKEKAEAKTREQQLSHRIVRKVVVQIRVKSDRDHGQQ
jgi:hypothetical protein